MAAKQKQVELKLNVPAGVNAHLMTMAHNPPVRSKPYARVGFWLATDVKGESGETVWFDVPPGDFATAQAVLDGEALEVLYELLGLDAPEQPASVVVIDRADGIQAEEASEAGQVLAAYAAPTAEAPESKRAGKRAAHKG